LNKKQRVILITPTNIGVKLIKMRKIIYLTLSACLVFSCSKPYYGYDKATWDSLSPKYKAKLIKEMDELRQDSTDIKSENKKTESLFRRVDRL